MRAAGLFFLSAIVLATATPAAPPERQATPFSGPGNDIRIAISPDGQYALWGAPGRGTDIVLSKKTATGWSKPKVLPFNSPFEDNDPFFSADGKTVLFISSRQGGLGRYDIYSVSFDPGTGRWGNPVNLGPNVNTSSDEWAPSFTPDGKLMFSSSGRGGFGRQDLFQSERGANGWQKPVNLGSGINTAEDNFDATLVPGGRFLIYSQGIAGQTDLRLNYAEWNGTAWQAKGELPAAFNCGRQNYAPAFVPGESGTLYWSGNCAAGRDDVDIWRAPLNLP